MRAKLDALFGYEKGSLLGNLEVRELPVRPIGTEAWFLVWIGVPPRSPYTVTMGLYAFDGQFFHVAWRRDDFVTPNVTRAISVSRDGSFSVSTMPDQPPGKVVIEQYAVTADGPQKVGER